MFKRVLFLYVVAIAVRHRGETHEGDTPLLFICKVFLKKIVKGHLIDLKNFYPPFPHFSSPYRKQGEIQNNEFFIVSLL